MPFVIKEHVKKQPDKIVSKEFETRAQAIVEAFERGFVAKVGKKHLLQNNYSIEEINSTETNNV